MLGALLLVGSACGIACGPSMTAAPMRTRVPSMAVPSVAGAKTDSMAVPSYVAGAKMDEMAEAATIAMLKKLESLPVTLPLAMAAGPVSASFVRTAVASGGTAPLVVLHGFDSSCLEFRRLLPELEQRGVEAYALDVFGWGFADTSGALTVSVEAKRAHLYAFWKEVLGGRPMALAGVSLGAAVIIDFYAAHPEAVASAALIDPQGFIDGAPPVPEPLARGGIKVLGSWPLRSAANQLAYFDTAVYATDDAIRVGLLHCARPGWEDDSVDWLLGGGYSVSPLVPRLAAINTLVMWGRQDKILPPEEYAPKFKAALPAATFRWVEECGHSPHLEQPAVLADALAAFLRGEAVGGDADFSEVVALANRTPVELAQARLAAMNAFLDRPLLDTNERGGPLEPLKAWVRTDPETAQLAASVVAVTFFALLFKAAVGVFVH